MERAAAAVILLIMCAFGARAASGTTAGTRKAVEALDRAMDHADEYIARRQARIDSLTAVYRRHGDNATLHSIIDEYSAFTSDSAIHYAARGMQANSGDEALRFRLKLISLLPLSGLANNAVSMWTAIRPDSVPAPLREAYFDNGRRKYSFIASYYSTYPALSDSLQREADRLQDSLLTVLAPGSVAYRFNLGEHYMSSGEYGRADALMSEIVADTSAEARAYAARAYHHLSTLARRNADDELALGYLARSATADVLSATREVISLQEMGSAMYGLGDIDRAHRYLSAAIENSVECHAVMRMIQSSRALPLVARSHASQTSHQRRVLQGVILVMVLLMCGLCATLLTLRRKMQRLEAMRASLRAANSAKDMYLSQFLRLCSVYMDKLTSLNRNVERKITSGRVDELLRLIRSGKMIEEQNDEFYEVFDNAFLHIYPTFVDDVNSLLRDDSRIELREGELLNTDLRILALMRMGISESARIAQILNYSLNTIYTYRNKLKGRALDRDSFEASVMAINSDNGAATAAVSVK